MTLLLWITIASIVSGIVVLASMKKSMERKLTLIIENEGKLDSEPISAKPIIYWIWGVIILGILSMALIVWSFSVY